MFIVQDTLALIEEFVQDFRRIIMNDSELAAQALRDLGAAQHNLLIRGPKDVDLEDVTPLGESDHLTLKKPDVSSMRRFLNIHKALSKGPDETMSIEVFGRLAAVVLSALNHASYQDFMVCI